MYYFADIRGGIFDPFGTGFYGKAESLADAEIDAGLRLAVLQDQPQYADTIVYKVKEVVTYPVPFICGDGTDAIMLDVQYIVSGVAIGYDSTCAFCQGDPCAETSAPETLIGAYFSRNKGHDWGETCPCCSGQAL